MPGATHRAFLFWINNHPHPNRAIARLKNKDWRESPTGGAKVRCLPLI